MLPTVTHTYRQIPSCDVLARYLPSRVLLVLHTNFSGISLEHDLATRLQYALNVRRDSLSKNLHRVVPVQSCQSVMSESKYTTLIISVVGKK